VSGRDNAMRSDILDDMIGRHDVGYDGVGVPDLRSADSTQWKRCVLR